jgi:hypothetical protein
MKRSIACGISAAVLATTMIAPPAHAEYYSVVDPADDASSSLTDVHGMRVRHGGESVTVMVAFDDVRRNSAAGVSIFFDTVKSRRGPEYVLSSGLGDGTDYALTRAWRWRARGEHVDCDYRARVKWGRDRIRAVLDRGCFGEPDEIRASARMGDVADGSHPVIDWVPGRRAWGAWLSQGS